VIPSSILRQRGKTSERLGGEKNRWKIRESHNREERREHDTLRKKDRDPTIRRRRKERLVSRRTFMYRQSKGGKNYYSKGRGEKIRREIKIEHIVFVRNARLLSNNLAIRPPNNQKNLVISKRGMKGRGSRRDLRRNVVVGIKGKTVDSQGGNALGDTLKGGGRIHSLKRDQKWEKGRTFAYNRGRVSRLGVVKRSSHT